MTKASLSQAAALLAEKFDKKEGVFLSARCEGAQNTMTIGWGAVGYFWGRGVFLAPVRHSRYTLPLIQNSGVFTVSIPRGAMADALALCGTKSGRDIDKWKAAGITPQNASAVDAPVVAEADLHIECRVVHQLDMALTPIPEEIAARWYGKGDPHYMIYGEIVAIWEK